MGVRTRGLDIKTGAVRLKADKAALPRPSESPSRHWPRHALVPNRAARPHALARRLLPVVWISARSICGRSTPSPPSPLCTLVLGLRWSRCPGSAPMPKLIGLYALLPAASDRRGEAQG